MKVLTSHVIGLSTIWPENPLLIETELKHTIDKGWQKGSFDRGDVVEMCSYDLFLFFFVIL